MELTEFLTHLEKVKGHDGQYIACCPAHNDKNPSLSVSEGQDGKILLNCHVGCSTYEIINAMGLKMSDLFPDEPQISKKHKVAEYI